MISNDRNKKNPYYIVAPAYIHTSAGIRVLHLLCHYLNIKGERAYLIISSTPVNNTCIELYTPLLTQEKLIEDFNSGLCPIMIYPETINGNFLQAPFVIRYLLNFPGLLGGEKNIYDDFILSYSQLIAEKTERSDCTLFMPVSDPELFRPIAGIERKGSCFYADKYKKYHGQKTFKITDDSFEITRDEPSSLSQKEVAALLAKSEIFYCYENSSLIVEATLCGCPVVLLDNPYFSELIGKYEYGTDGIAFDSKPESIAHAKKTVSLAREHYFLACNKFNDQLEQFIKLTQNEVTNFEYKIPIKIVVTDSTDVTECAVPTDVDDSTGSKLLCFYKKIVFTQLKFYYFWASNGFKAAFRKSIRKLVSVIIPIK